MSWRATAWASAQRTGHPTLKVILLILADLSDEYGYSWPRIATLADACEVSADTIHRGIKKLTDAGMIEVSPRWRADGSQTTNGYRLTMCPAPKNEGREEGVANCGGGAPMQSQPPRTDATPNEPTSINRPSSPSSSASPQKKGGAPKAKAPKWTDKPLSERMGRDGIPVTRDGDEDWPALVWEVQLPKLTELAKQQTGKPVSQGSARGRIGKLIKASNAHAVSVMIAQVLKSVPGGCPFDYLEGVRRGAAGEEDMARKAMFAPIDY